MLMSEFGMSKSATATTNIAGHQMWPRWGIFMGTQAELL